MSASEKLRERPWLIEEGTRFRCVSEEQMAQIVAVVEAAEHFYSAFAILPLDTESGLNDLGTALAALDEALE